MFSCCPFVIPPDIVVTEYLNVLFWSEFRLCRNSYLSIHAGSLKLLSVVWLSAYTVNMTARIATRP